MPNDYPNMEYVQANGKGRPLTDNAEGEDIV